MPDSITSQFGYRRKYTGVPIEGLGNLNINDESDNDIIFFNEASGKWENTSNPSGSAAISSISSLATSGNEMLYTVATDTYALSAISSAGRGLVSAATSADQQAVLELVPGTDVQAQSGPLSNLDVIGAASADQVPYTTGSGFSNTALGSFARTSVLPATSASELATAIGSFTGSGSTTGSVMRVTGVNTLSESGVGIDASDNLTGLNDVAAGGDITATGTINGAGSNAMAQVANINANTITSEQWGFLSGLDQNLDTSSTPTFTGANMGSGRVTALADPTAGQDAATKSYVDSVAATGAAPLVAVRLATAAVLPNAPSYTSGSETLTSTGGPGALVVDGVAVSVGDRVLVKDQAADTENGVYVVTDDGASAGPNYVLTRASDFDQASMPIGAGTSVFVSKGSGASVNAGTTWALRAPLTTIDPLGDDVEWVQLGAINSYTAGSGVDAAQLASLNIQADISARLKFSGTELDLNTVGVPYGGTGATTLAPGNVLVGAGTSAVTSAKPAPSGTFVGTSDTQTLTNKTISAPTNDVVARSLFSGSGTGVVSTFAATAPSTGQVLTATSGTTADWQTPATAAFTPDRTLFVYQSAADVSPNWATVAGAIADAVTLTPTAADPVIIFLYPGTYAEATPITIPANVTLSGMTAAQSSVVVAPTAPAPVAAVFRMEGSARMYGMTVDGYDGVGAYATIGVESVIGTAYSIDYCNAVTVKNCSTAAFSVTGDGSNRYSKILSCRASSALVTASFPFACGAGYRVAAGGLLTGNDMTASGFLSGGGTLNRAIYVLNDFSYADLTTMQISSCSSGIVVGGGVSTNSNDLYPYARVLGCRMGLITDKAVELLAKSHVYISDLVLTDDTGVFPDQLDLHITNPALPAQPNLVDYENSVTRISRTSLLNGASTNPPTISGLAYSRERYENQSFFFGSLVVGYPLQGQELVVGEGNSHSITMVVKTDDGGVFIDETSQLNTINPTTSAGVDLSTTGSINLVSAPATIDGATPVSGTTRVLVKDGSTSNPGTTSVDNGVYVWNGLGSAMTRATDFPSGEIFYFNTSFSVASGDTLYGSRWQVDPSSFPSDLVTIGTTAFAVGASSVTPFPLSSPATGDAFYVGSSGNTNFKFPGLAMTITSPLTLVVDDIKSTLVWEYWDGSAWSALHIMSTLADRPYTSYANKSFGYMDTTVGNPDSVEYQVRFGGTQGWATTTIDGDNGYWVRCRLADAANISQMPVVSRIKLHTNNTDINKDGFVEFFGASNTLRTITIPSASLLDPGSGSRYGNPQNQRLVPDSGGLMSAQMANCQFNAGTDTAQSYVCQMPLELDTSRFVKMIVSFTKQTPTVTNRALALRVLYCCTPVGSGIGVPGGGPPTVLARDTGIINTVITTGGAVIQEQEFELDLTEHHPDNEILWITFAREGTDASDTYGAQIYVFKWSLLYNAWCLGTENE